MTPFPVLPLLGSLSKKGLGVALPFWSQFSKPAIPLSSGLATHALFHLNPTFSGSFGFLRRAGTVSPFFWWSLPAV